MKKFIKFIPTKMLNTLQNLTFPKDVSLEKCIIMVHMVLFQFLRSEDNKITQINHPDFSFKINLVELSGALLKLGIGENYSKVVKFMIENNLIITDNHFRVIGFLKCKSYGINPNQMDSEVGKLVAYEIDDLFLNKHTEKAINSIDDDKKGYTKKGLPCSKDLITNINNLQYDDVSALDWLKYLYDNKIPYRGKILNEFTMLIIETKINNLKNGNNEPLKYRFINRNTTNGRINSDITTLNSNFRRFIKGDNLYSIDCNASQPTLLLVLKEFIKNPLIFDGMLKYMEIYYKNNISIKKDEKNKGRYIATQLGKLFEALQSVKLPDDDKLKLFKNVIEKGNKDFYESLVDFLYVIKSQNYIDKVFPNDTNQRDIVKKMVMQELYSDSPSDIILTCYPEIGKFINNIKQSFKILALKNNPNQEVKLCRMFSITMQLIESYIWIERIIPKISSLGITYYTIHDSVLIPEKNKDEVNKIIEDIFKEFNINVKLTIENNNIVKEFKKSREFKKLGFEL